MRKVIIIIHTLFAVGEKFDEAKYLKTTGVVKMFQIEAFLI